MKNLLSIFAIICSTLTFAQKIELKGKITDTDKKPVEAATVYLSSKKDSTLMIIPLPMFQETLKCR